MGICRSCEEVLHHNRCLTVRLCDDGQDISVLLLFFIGKLVVRFIAHLVFCNVQEQFAEPCTAAVVVRKLIQHVVNILRSLLICRIVRVIVFSVFFNGGKKAVHKRNNLLLHLRFHQRLIFLYAVTALHIHQGKVGNRFVFVLGGFVTEVNRFVTLSADTGSPCVCVKVYGFAVLAVQKRIALFFGIIIIAFKDLYLADVIRRVGKNLRRIQRSH